MQIIKNTFFTISLLLVVTSLLAIEVDKNESYIQFSGVQNKKTAFQGRFENFEPIIIFDEEDLENSSITVFVDLASVNSHSEKRDAMLKNANWFDVESMPKGKFESNKIVPLEGEKYRVYGVLTLRNISKPIELLMQIRKNKNLINFSGKYTLNRLDFELGLGAWKNPDWVKHEVEIQYQVIIKK